MTPKQILISLATLLLVLASGAAAAADLSGTWRANDGGTYYLNQVGNELYWYGENRATAPTWSNVFRGHVQGERVRGEWADVPKGKTRNHGEMRLEVHAGGNELRATRKTGGFGGSVWKRQGAPVAVMPMPHPRPAAPQEDCVRFNPATTELKLVNNSWKIVDGSHWMFDFGPRQVEGQQALRVIKQYGTNRSCFVGRPHASLTYLLVGDAAPQGGVPGEDCVSFNPHRATVERINGHWKIVDGSHWLFDFEGKENEARHALAIIKHHRFDRSCFVGRPDPSFSYLRR